MDALTPTQLLPGVPPPVATDKPYAAPVVWKDWEKRYGVARPYDTPFAEYVENVHEPKSAKELIARWKDTPEENDILSWWGTLAAKVARSKRQMERAKASDVLATLTSLDYQDYERIQNIELLKEKLLWIETVFAEGKMKRPERNGNPQDGYKWEDVERVLGMEDRAKLIELERKLVQQIDRLRSKQDPVGDGKEDIRLTLIQNIENQNNYLPGTNRISWAEMKAIAAGEPFDGETVQGEVVETEKS
jgi:hypothetical protein